MLVPLHVLLMTFYILAVTGNHLPLAYMQSHTHASFGRCESSECIFFLPTIKPIICSETSVKQYEPLWETSSDMYSFSVLAQVLHFAFISQFEMRNSQDRLDL
jgi:hypothetical protein